MSGIYGQMVRTNTADLCGKAEMVSKAGPIVSWLFLRRLVLYMKKRLLYRPASDEESAVIARLHGGGDELRLEGLPWWRRRSASGRAVSESLEEQPAAKGALDQSKEQKAVSGESDSIQQLQQDALVFSMQKMHRWPALTSPRTSFRGPRRWRLLSSSHSPWHGCEWQQKAVTSWWC